MTDQQAEDERGAEIVPFRSVSEVSPEPGSPPAPPDDNSLAEAAETSGPAERKVIYASITAVGERKPIIPVPLQRENLRGTMEQFAGLSAHRAAYHGLRLPWYLIASAVWAIIGVFRLLIRQIHWAWLLEVHELKTDTVLAGNSKEYRSLHAMQVKWRAKTFTVLSAEAFAALVLSLWLTFVAPAWVEGAAAAAAGVLAARFGLAGHRIIAPAIVPSEYQKPTDSSVVEALGKIGIPALTKAVKDGPGIRIISPGVGRDGPGWSVQADLPHGVTVTQVRAKREELASALRRPLSAVWPEGVPVEHPGRLDLWIGMHDVSKAKPPKYPLLKAGATDFFERIPLGTDPRLRPVTVPLFETSYLLGAAPGQGKTSGVRAIAAGAALDPVVDLWVHEQAGKGDLEPFARVAHRYCSGLDDDAIAYAAESAAMLRRDLERRSELLKSLPKELRPHGKLTRDLAVRFARLRPIVAIFDEAQNVVLHPVHGEQFADDIAHVMRLGRAYGIVIVFATQRPDAKSLPAAISANVTSRLCLKVNDQITNDMVLGTGSYKAGFDASLFRFGTDAGLAWLKSDAEPQIIRTYYLDLLASEKVAERARIMRERAGVLSGYALGLEDAAAPSRDVLADLLAAFGDDDKMQWGDAANRLAERWPDRWADLSGDALSAQCRTLGVKSVDVRNGATVLKGCRRIMVEQAQERVAVAAGQAP